MLDNWLSYMSNEYYGDEIYSLFDIDKNSLKYTTTNSNIFFNNAISQIKNNIDLKNGNYIGYTTH